MLERHPRPRGDCEFLHDRSRASLDPVHKRWLLVPRIRKVWVTIACHCPSCGASVRAAEAVPSAPISEVPWRLPTLPVLYAAEDVNAACCRWVDDDDDDDDDDEPALLPLPRMRSASALFVPCWACTSANMASTAAFASTNALVGRVS